MGGRSVEKLPDWIMFNMSFLRGSRSASACVHWLERDRVCALAPFRCGGFSKKKTVV